MTRINIRRPKRHECHAYYTTYINKVADDDFFKTLVKALDQTTVFLGSLSSEQWNYRYAEDKWTVKELVLHIIDTERIFANRALRIARNDMTPIAGFDQDDYVPFSEADDRSPSSIFREYQAVRNSAIELFRNFSDDMYDRLGTASERPFTPLSIGFIIAGHEIYHLNILKERYLHNA
jgi:uncharacterized damage-inducible protein DinB